MVLPVTHLRTNALPIGFEFSSGADLPRPAQQRKRGHCGVASTLPQTSHRMSQQCPRFRAQAQTSFVASIGFEFSTAILGFKAQPSCIQPIGFVFSPPQATSDWLCFFKKRKENGDIAGLRQHCPKRRITCRSSVPIFVPRRRRSSSPQIGLELSTSHPWLRSAAVMHPTHWLPFFKSAKSPNRHILKSQKV